MAAIQKEPEISCMFRCCNTKCSSPPSIEKLYKCPGCQVANYCSPACCQSDEKEHAKRCANTAEVHRTRQVTNSENVIFKQILPAFTSGIQNYQKEAIKEHGKGAVVVDVPHFIKTGKVVCLYRIFSRCTGEIQQLIKRVEPINAFILLWNISDSHTKITALQL